MQSSRGVIDDEVFDACIDLVPAIRLGSMDLKEVEPGERDVLDVFDARVPINDLNKNQDGGRKGSREESAQCKT